MKEIQPKLFIAENVKGLLSHSKGQTFSIILNTLRDLGYRVSYKLLKAVEYSVPQRRERIIIAGVRRDIKENYHFPVSHFKKYTLYDALKKSDLYAEDTPKSKGFCYSDKIRKYLALIPAGGNWRDLLPYLQRECLGKMLGQGSNSQMLKRLHWNQPCLTLLTSPHGKRTCRCHPDEIRPLTVREYARVQTFPDDWLFLGSLSSQYRQIGNAVPVNLSKAIATATKDFLIRHKKPHNLLN